MPEHMTCELTVQVDEARLDRIIERGQARMRRLSRRKRKAEWQHIRNQIKECVAVIVAPKV